MVEIEEAARNYAAGVTGVNHKKTAARDFVEGAKFAMSKAPRWVSVKESLPPLGSTVIAKRAGRWINLARYLPVKEELIGSRLLHKVAPSGKGEWIIGNTNRNWDVTHWMKLPES